MSCVSGLSNISAISGINSTAGHVSNNDHNEEDFEELVGSQYFISPEMIEFRKYSYSSDLWALGVMLFQFFTAKLPFKGKSQDDTFRLIKLS